MLIRGISLFEWTCTKSIGTILAITVGYITVRIGNSINMDYFPQKRYYYITIIIWVILFYLLLRYGEHRNRVIFSVSCTVMMIYAGALVNPVRQGVDDIYNNEVVQAIQDVHEQDVEALWAIEPGLPINNVGIMVGAPTINSTNVYPCIERWETLDKKGRKKKVYNRYAHISVGLKESGEAEFQLNAPDSFNVLLTGEDMKILKVKYYMSSKDDLDMYETDKVKFSKIKEAGNYYIYKIQ